MAEQQKKSGRSNAGSRRKTAANIRRVLYRTELRKKLVHVYRSCGLEAGNAYVERLLTVDAVGNESQSQRMARFAQTDVYKKLANKERARIAERKARKEAR